jgi:hypothetical protein
MAASAFISFIIAGGTGARVTELKDQTKKPGKSETPEQQLNKEMNKLNKATTPQIPQGLKDGGIIGEVMENRKAKRIQAILKT